MAVRKAAAPKAAPKEDAGTEDEGRAEDRVASVSRYADGSAAQSPNFVLLLPENASDADKASAWNNDGELPDEAHVEYYPVPEQF